MRRLPQFLFLALLCSVPSSAQIDFEEEPLWIFDYPLEGLGLFWDVDGNGIMDWMVYKLTDGTNRSGWIPGQNRDDLFGPLILWPNWGITLDTIFLADTDHDGDLDLFIEGPLSGDPLGRIDHYHNEAGNLTGTFWQAPIGGDPSGYTLGDVDGDGNLDLFTTYGVREYPMSDALYRGVPGGSFESA